MEQVIRTHKFWGPNYNEETTDDTWIVHVYNTNAPGCVGVYFHFLLTSAIDCEKRSDSGSGRFTPGQNTLVTFAQNNLCFPKFSGFLGEKNPFLPRNCSVVRPFAWTLPPAHIRLLFGYKLKCKFREVLRFPRPRMTEVWLFQTAKLRACFSKRANLRFVST